MAYSLSSFDVCVQGFERLRNRNEFILATPIFDFSTLDDIKEALNDDIQACMRPDHFDFDAASTVVDELCATLAPLFAKSANPFHLEERDEQADDCEPCYLFVYVSDDSHEYSVWGD